MQDRHLSEFERIGIKAMKSDKTDELEEFIDKVIGGKS